MCIIIRKWFYIFYCCKGVRQEDDLLPLLFSLFIHHVEIYSANTACEGVKIDGILAYVKVLVLMYAHDMVLLNRGLMNYSIDYMCVGSIA